MLQTIRTILNRVFPKVEDCNIKTVKIIERYENLFELFKGEKEIIETLTQQRNTEIELLNSK